MTEDDPTFLSDDESEQVFQILDRTPQIDRKEALRRVIGDERMSRLLMAETAAGEADEQQDTLSEQTPEELAEAQEARAFAGQMADERIFDINEFLAKHPGREADAIRLGFLDPEE